LVLRRLSLAHRIDEIVVATTQLSEDDVLVEAAGGLGFRVVRGDTNDLVARYLRAAIVTKAERIVRITADCPLIDAAVVDALVSELDSTDADIVWNYEPPTFPDGLDAAVMTREALEIIDTLATEAHDREHVTTLVERDTHGLNIVNVEAPEDLAAHRWTLDTTDDYVFLQSLCMRLGPVIETAGFRVVLDAVSQHPPLLDAGRKWSRNFGHGI
jgi:glutamate-1-semialdehyde 2,1-aminomutase